MVRVGFGNGRGCGGTVDRGQGTGNRGREEKDGGIEVCAIPPFARKKRKMVHPHWREVKNQKNLGCATRRVDAAVLDASNLPRGYWEAKDEKDDLREEVNKKFAAGYPRTNILSQASTTQVFS
jgi:hypothetical protein